ncbi:MAG TPA: PhnD/SsuA/transferrin family substrate-binding protein [Paracoccaceae bacterium]|nr:PhnD/SsuA/transferrin family substrate-binding protein [Paracoccaceae bacterium]
MIAALPMYDWPEIRDATDALWAALRPRLAAAGFAAPETLTRDRPPEAVWADLDLLFAQTCGLPYVAGAARPARIVATPDYAAEGCGAGRYSSALVVRRGEGAPALSGRRFAVNDFGSLSGWAAPLAKLGAAAIGETVLTGAHRASVLAVAEGRADAAAVDAVAWDLARRFEPSAEALEVVGWTDPAPAPPYVTSALTESGGRARLRAALVETLVDAATAAIRAELRLTRIVAFADVDYDPARKLAAGLRAAAGRTEADAAPAAG